MSDLTITTNGHHRELYSLFTAPQSLQAVADRDFGYVPVWAPGHHDKTFSRFTNTVKCECGAIYCEEYSEEFYSERFFQYKGEWYDDNEFETVRGTLLKESGWHALSIQSAFHAIVLRHNDGMDNTVTVGYATW